MEIYMDKIKINNISSSDFVTVTVIFHDNEKSPHKSATVDVYIDKKITNIDDIKNKAISEAKSFMATIIA